MQVYYYWHFTLKYELVYTLVAGKGEQAQVSPCLAWLSIHFLHIFEHNHNSQIISFKKNKKNQLRLLCKKFYNVTEVYFKGSPCTPFDGKLHLTLELKVIWPQTRWVPALRKLNRVIQFPQVLKLTSLHDWLTFLIQYSRLNISFEDNFFPCK